MPKALSYKYILLAVVLLGIGACKHKKVEVAAVQKHPSKKPVVKATPAHTTPSGSQAGSNELQQKLGITSKQIKESKLYSFIDDWYGTPYKYAGCQKTGIDCSCFANILYEKIYGKKIARSTLEMFKACDEISIEEAHTGDLLFFKIGGNTISHVGIYIWGKLFVHASTSKGVIVNSLDEAYYKKYFFCAGKMKNV